MLFLDKFVTLDQSWGLFGQFLFGSAAGVGVTQTQWGNNFRGLCWLGVERGWRLSPQEAQMDLYLSKIDILPAVYDYCIYCSLSDKRQKTYSYYIYKVYFFYPIHPLNDLSLPRLWDQRKRALFVCHGFLKSFFYYKHSIGKVYCSISGRTPSAQVTSTMFGNNKPFAQTL
jgi:hypothetical protein